MYMYVRKRIYLKKSKIEICNSDVNFWSIIASYYAIIRFGKNIAKNLFVNNSKN